MSVLFRDNFNSYSGKPTEQETTENRKVWPSSSKIRNGIHFQGGQMTSLLNDLEAEIKKPMSNQEEMQIFQDFCESELDQQMDTNFS